MNPPARQPPNNRPQGARKRTVLEPAVRREQLLDAAAWVFARKGYRNASIADIIERAGVARGTFYLYFDSKEQVFLTIVEAFHARIRHALARAGEMPDIGTDARALLVTRFAQWLEFFAAHRDVARVILREASSIDPRFEQGYAALRASAVAFLASRTRQLQELGLVRGSVSPELVAHLQLGMLDEVLTAFVLQDAGADIPRLAEDMVDLQWNGLRPD